MENGMEKAPSLRQLYIVSQSVFHTENVTASHTSSEKSESIEGTAPCTSGLLPHMTKSTWKYPEFKLFLSVE